MVCLIRGRRVSPSTALTIRLASDLVAPIIRAKGAIRGAEIPFRKKCGGHTNSREVRLATRCCPVRRDTQLERRGKQTRRNALLGPSSSPANQGDLDAIPTVEYTQLHKSKAALLYRVGFDPISVAPQHSQEIQDGDVVSISGGKVSVTCVPLMRPLTASNGLICMAVASRGCLSTSSLGAGSPGTNAPQPSRPSQNSASKPPESGHPK